MEVHELTCIRCPIGCELRVEVENNEVTKVEGYSCKRGLDYAHKEILNPTRTITSILPLNNGTIRMVPVKTTTDIPKPKIDECFAILKNKVVEAPVHVGDVIIENIGDTGADLVATRTIPQK